MTPTYEQAHQWLTDEREQRFWQMIAKQPNGCWVWQGSLSDSGHGQYAMYGGTARVHRLTWMLARERDIPDGLVIRHLLCDNTRCCNPRHLVGGSQGENCRDTWAIHQSYRNDVEHRARQEYLKHSYVGYFSESISNPSLCDGQQSTRLEYAAPMRCNSLAGCVANL